MYDNAWYFFTPPTVSADVNSAVTRTMSPIGDEIIFSEDFEGSINELLKTQGQGLKKSIAPTGENAYEMDLMTAQIFGFMFDEPLTPGVYCYSFGFYAEAYVAQVYATHYTDGATGINDTNQWYSVSIWMDSVNEQVAIWLDGCLISLHDQKVSHMKGFGIRHWNTTKSDLKWYFDNIKFTRDTTELAGGFCAGYVNAETDDSVIFKNFYKDVPPEFILRMNTRTPSDFTGEFLYRVKTWDGYLVYESDAAPIIISAGETDEKTILLKNTPFGRMDLEVILKR